MEHYICFFKYAPLICPNNFKTEKFFLKLNPKLG